MLYLGLYLVSGLIANVAMLVHTEHVYKGLDYEDEYDEAVDEVNDCLSEHFGRMYIPAIIVGTVVLFAAWPIMVFIAWHRCTNLINAIITYEDDDECPDED